MDFEEVMWVKKGPTIAFVVKFSQIKKQKPIENLASRLPKEALDFFFMNFVYDTEDIKFLREINLPTLIFLGHNPAMPYQRMTHT